MSVNLSNDFKELTKSFMEIIEQIDGALGMDGLQCKMKLEEMVPALIENHKTFQTNAISYIFGEVGQILHAEPTHTNIVKMSGDSAGDVVMDIDPESKYRHIFYNPAESYNEIVPDDANANKSLPLTNAKRERRKWSHLEIDNTRQDPKLYRLHKCSNECVKDAEKGGIPDRSKSNATMLVRPMLMGWERKMDDKKIVYTTPCGLIRGRMCDVNWYLVSTKSSLSIDCFTFDVHVDCLRTCQTVYDPKYILEDDISNGLEKFPIRVVNQRTDGRPAKFTYIIKNHLTDSVPNYLNDSRMSCCDCTDNCADKSKCSCWRLTLGAKGSVGYKYRRLYNEVKTGIFECNSNCKCSQIQCLNRVAQNPIDHKLELFKTKNCGWGIRTLVDIPKGAFICCYYGEIVDELVANRSDIFGGEYFARLDNVIKSAEFHKEVYESSPKRPVSTEADSESNGFDTVTASEQPDSKSTNWEKYGMENLYPFQYRKKENEAINATGVMIDDKPTDYVIDGKHLGNIGRFFNHSCDPNMFAQNIFADTHDLRFPWYGLFAANRIKAGDELTWDYNYEIIESSPKQIICKCGAKECRRRLL